MNVWIGDGPYEGELGFGDPDKGHVVLKGLSEEYLDLLMKEFEEGEW